MSTMEERQVPHLHKSYESTSLLYVGELEHSRVPQEFRQRYPSAEVARHTKRQYMECIGTRKLIKAVDKY